MDGVTYAEDRVLTPPGAVLFDWDDTLVENWLTLQAAINAALADAGLPDMDLAMVKFQARHSSRQVFPALFGDGAARAAKVFYAHFAANHLKGLQVMPGAVGLLDALAGQGIPLAVVSNKKGDLLRQEIAHLGWANRFRAVVGGQDAAADKPDPAPVHMALAQGNLLSARDVWLVGDTDIDMQAAIAAGCIPVLVGEGPSDPNLLAGAPPALRCRDCLALEGFVRRRGVTICESNGIGGQGSA